MKDQVTSIELRAVWARALLVVLLALVALVTWYGVRWCIGNTMAETAPASYSTDPTAAFESAEAAATWLPPSPGPGGEGLPYEVAAVAIFCAPMLLAEPASVRPPEVLAEVRRAASGGER